MVLKVWTMTFNEANICMLIRRRYHTHIWYFETLQLSTLELEQACQKWGLKSNPLKCAILTLDSKVEIEIDNNVVPKVSKFTFLGSFVPDCYSDVQHRIALASQAFGRLITIWSSKDESIHLKTLRSTHSADCHIRFRIMDYKIKINRCATSVWNEMP